MPCTSPGLSPCMTVCCDVAVCRAPGHEGFVNDEPATPESKNYCGLLESSSHSLLLALAHDCEAAPPWTTVIYCHHIVPICIQHFCHCVRILETVEDMILCVHLPTAISCAERCECGSAVPATQNLCILNSKYCNK